MANTSIHNYLAFDLGAESGRAIHGMFTGEKLQLTEVNRFYNGYLNIRGRYHWDTFRIYDEMCKSLAKCTASKLPIESMAIDTWGVDFGLLAKDGSLIGMPYAYRDHQTDGMIEQFIDKVMPKKKLYKLTGIQLMQFNTIFQLYAMHEKKSPLLDIATDLLFTPDLLNYLFTGVKKTEFTIASTSQLLNPNTRKWESSLLSAIGMTRNIMGNVILPGTIIGETNYDAQNGSTGLPLIAVTSHDTASAIAAVPANTKNWAYLSSGTWSLMGVEIDQPIINDFTSEMEFTNEGGVDGKYNLLKNIGGLWLLQQCKKEWDCDSSNIISYEQLTQMSGKSKPFTSFIDTDASDFYNPESMLQAIIRYCQKTNQKVPSSQAEFARCIFDSLAMKYRLVFNQLNSLVNHPINELYVIGGGAKNKLLCQLTANALGIPVLTGPSEATAVGNILVQAKALGHVSSLTDIRTICRNSFESERFLPKETNLWNNEFERYMEIINHHVKV